jgi:hypothetical protein
MNFRWFWTGSNFDESGWEFSLPRSNILSTHVQLSCNSCSRLTGAWKSRKLWCKFSLSSSYLYSCSRLTRTWELRKLSCKLSLLSSHATFVLVWPGHESRENSDVNSRFPTLMDSCSRLTRTWELRKLSCKLSLFNSHQLSCNSCSRLTGAWKSIKLSCKFSLLNSHQLVFLFDHGLTFETLVKRGCMKVVENRPYRLFTFHPMASFSCQILTHVLCLVGLKITFVIEPKNSKKQIRPGKHGNIIFICPWHAKIS